MTDGDVTEMMIDARRWVNRHADSLFAGQISFDEWRVQIWRVLIRFSLDQEAAIRAAIDRQDRDGMWAIIDPVLDVEFGNKREDVT